MGNKISWESAEKCGIQSTDRIICEPNKYDYKVNINHPKIRPLYERFKRIKKAVILSDQERFEFEAAIMRMIESKRRENNGKI